MLVHSYNTGANGGTRARAHARNVTNRYKVTWGGKKTFFLQRYLRAGTRAFIKLASSPRKVPRSTLVRVLTRARARADI